MNRINSDKAYFDAVAMALRAPAQGRTGSAGAADPLNDRFGIAVYRNNIRSAYAKALAETFPAVEMLVGEEFFKFAARRYFDVTHASSPLVAEWGRNFPEFIDRFEPARATPYLGDIARLEWARVSAQRAADATPLTAADIAALAGDALERARFKMHPALRLIQSPYAIVSIWRRCRTAGDHQRVDGGVCEHALVARPQNDVIVRDIAVGEFCALNALQMGETVENAFNAAAARDKRFDAQTAFQLMFECGVIVAKRESDEEG